MQPAGFFLDHQNEPVLVECLKPEGTVQHLVPQRLRLGVDLHIWKGRSLSTALALPPAFKQTNYLPAVQHGSAVEESQEILRITSKAPVKLYVAWPQLQEPPLWLDASFTLFRGAEVKVRWSDFTFKQHFWLNITDQWRSYREQPLLIYRLSTNNGVLQPGEVLELPAVSTHPQGSTLLPYVSHIVCLQPVAANNNNSANPAAGLPVSSKDGRSVTSYSPEELYTALDEGTCNPAELSQQEADVVVKKSMLAADHELLFMLLEAGIGQTASQPCLRLLLQYAHVQDLLQLALLVLRYSVAEMTPEVLDWFVGNMVSKKYVYGLEAALAQYCLCRRNPFSSVAAIEQALEKAATASLVVDEDALKLSKKFKAAKIALLQHLLTQFGSEGTTNVHPGRQAIGQQQSLSSTQQLFSSNDGNLDARLSVLHLKPLQQALHYCMQHTSAYAIGRGGSMGPSSIHDSSPWGMAVVLEDADLLRLPAMMEYTSNVWKGLELHRMAQALHKAVSAAYAGGEDGASSSSSSASTASGMPGKDSQFNHASTDAVAHSAFRPHPPGSPAASTPGRWATSDAKTVKRVNISTGVFGDGSQQDSTADSSSVVAKPSAGPVAEGIEQGPAYTKDSPAGQQSMTSTGTSAAFALSNSVGGSHEPVWMSPDVGMQLLQNLGLAGGIGSGLAQTGAQLLHGTLMAPRAFHNAPRGRWLKRCLFELWFLAVYQAYCLGTPEPIFLWSLPILLVGNLVNIGIEVHWLFKNDFGAYIKDIWAKLDIVVNCGMLAVLIFEHIVYANYGEIDAALEATPAGLLGIHIERVVPAAFAVLVWVRLMGVLLPASERLGALLYTMRRAAIESAFMVPLVLVMIIGFATSLYVFYGALVPGLGSFLKNVRTMFGLLDGASEFVMRDFDHDLGDHGLESLAGWGEALCIIYGVVVVILIMTLLVAIITKTYNVEYIKIKAVLQEAEAVQHYDWHGYRTRVAPSKYLKWGIFPIDGYVPAEIKGAPAMLIPTGPSEVGYLAFCLLVYPLISTAAVLLLILHLPFGVMHFAITGHKKWRISAWSRGRGTVYTPASGAGRARVSASLPGAAGQVGGPWVVKAPSTVKRMIDSNGSGQLTQSKAGIRNPITRTLLKWSSSVVTPSHLAGTAAPAGAASWSRPAASSSGLWATVYGLWLVFRLILRVVLAAVVGLVVHLLLLALVIVIIVWADVTRTFYSIYCIFIPAAADSPCCFTATRRANFWNRSNVSAAFVAAKVERKVASAGPMPITGDEDVTAAVAPGQAAASNSNADGHVFIAAKQAGTASPRVRSTGPSMEAAGTGTATPGGRVTGPSLENTFGEAVGVPSARTHASLTTL